MPLPTVQAGQSTGPPTSGSAVVTIPQTTRLVLRAAETPREQSPREEEGQHVRWAEDVVDNEGMGKKSSKVCCIYHRPHDPGASDSSEDSDSSGSDNENDDGRARPVGGSRRGHSKHKPHHHHDRNKDKGGGGEGKDNAKGQDRKPSPNAYEQMPRYAPAGKKHAGEG